MSVPLRAASRGVATAALFALVVGLVLGGAVPGSLGPAPLSLSETFASSTGSTCPGSLGNATYPGQLTVDGGPLPAPAVAAVGITYTYFTQGTSYWTSNGTIVGHSCTSEEGNATTNATGHFGFSIVPPSTTCVQEQPGGPLCTSYTAPNGPPKLTTAHPPPAGYGLSVLRSGPGYLLSFVADLTQLGLRPAGPLLPLASGAPGKVVATPEMANGSASPVTPPFTWTLSGAGWSYVSPPTGGKATVVGDPGAAIGELVVNASIQIGGRTFVAPARSLELEAVSTSVTGGALNRSVVDAGGSVGVEVEAVGATGYAYSATIAPGLGLAARTVPCATQPASAATVAVVCTSAVTYPSPGSGELSANVSNGYSSATWLSPPFAVDPPPELSLSPTDPAGYTGGPVSLTVSAAAGTGAAPYATACLEAGDLPPACSNAPGPTWTFDPTFASPGNYSVRAWAIDAAGTNRSTNTTVRIAAPLTIGPLGDASRNASAGVPLVLSAGVGGGLLPARVAWNASDLTGPFADAVVGADGQVTATFVPPAAGSVLVTVTVVDALGTAAESSLWVSVGPGPATAVVLVGAAPTASVVGRPVPLAWEAFDAWGEPVRNFSAPAALVLSGSAGPEVPAWVNVSGLGSRPANATGAFAIPAAAWVGGFLNLTVAPARAGDFTAGLRGAGLPGTPATVPLAIAPDLAHLKIFDPVVVLAGGGVNRTFWHVSDRFGDPVPGAELRVTLLSGSGSNATDVPVVPGPNGTSGAWVNYSFAGGSPPLLEILDPAGDILLGPVALASAAAPPAIGLAAAALGPGLLVAAVLALFVRRRRSRTAIPPTTDEGELERLAEGRARVLEIVDSAGSAGYDAIAGAWGTAPPPELVDWVASLVADGTLRTRPGPTGAEFCLVPAAQTAPRVTVDPDAAERALARREAAVRDATGDGDGSERS